jgi:hypothetical protein
MDSEAATFLIWQQTNPRLEFLQIAIIYELNMIFLIPFYLQAVQIHSANGVKLLEA